MSTETHTELVAELDRLRLKAFKSGLPADKDAYYGRLSIAFQRGEVVIPAAPVAPAADGSVAVNSHDALVAALRDAQERLANISSGRCPDAPPGTANEPVAFRAWAEGYAAIGYRLARAALSSIGGGN